jgi:t-SNARE syntaxin family protein
MSIPKEYYSNFQEVSKKQDEALKQIRMKLSNYQKAISAGGNTISMESEIEREIKNCKDITSQLDNAYSNRNAPSQIPGVELDRRQKEIQKISMNIQEIEKSFKNLQNQKYSFKGQMSDGYQQSEEMKTMSNSELLQLQKDKINEQDKVIDDVILDVKKGRVLAKETGHIIEDQNKQLDSLQEDIDRLDSRMQRGIKRFENYVAKQSGCCIIFILLVELAAAILIFVALK